MDTATLAALDAGASHCLFLVLGAGHSWSVSSRTNLFISSLEIKIRVKVLRGQYQAAAATLTICIAHSLLQDCVVEDLIEELDWTAPNHIMVPLLHQANMNRIGRRSGLVARLHARTAAMIAPVTNPGSPATHNSRSAQLRMASMRLAEAGALVDSNRTQGRR